MNFNCVFYNGKRSCDCRIFVDYMVIYLGNKGDIVIL